MTSSLPTRSRFSQASRVRKRAEFQRIQNGGRRVNSAHFVFVLAPTPNGKQGPRLGITASRKIGNAVARNRAKRLVRVAFRSTAELWPPGCDVVVIVRRPVTELKAADVVQEWRELAAVLRRRQKEVLEKACPDDPPGKHS